MLSQESRRTAGILLVVLPTVIYGGVSLLGFLLDRSSGYMENPLRQTSMRRSCPAAGNGSSARSSRPRPFFFRRRSSSRYSRRAPRSRTHLSIMAFVGAVALAIGLVTLGVGLLRAGRTASELAFRLCSDDPQVGAIRDAT